MMQFDYHLAFVQAKLFAVFVIWLCSVCLPRLIAARWQIKICIII